MPEAHVNGIRLYYQELFAPLREARAGGSGHRLGNPAKAGAAILRLVAEPKPPRHIVLGSDALRLVGEARHEPDAAIAAWQHRLPRWLPDRQLRIDRVP